MLGKGEDQRILQQHLQRVALQGRLGLLDRRGYWTSAKFVLTVMGSKHQKELKHGPETPAVQTLTIYLQYLLFLHDNILCRNQT